MLHFIAPLNILLRRRLTYRITDFYPECLIAGEGTMRLGAQVASPRDLFLAAPNRSL